jgi:5'-3' exonuclease
VCAADDALATAAARFAADVDRVVLLSPDKDLAQCVRGQRVVTHDRIRGVTYDEPAVPAKFGVGPASIPDLLALPGASAAGNRTAPLMGVSSRQKGKDNIFQLFTVTGSLISR